ncbi:hypothetical protein NB694_004496 [Pantoea ananatis]|uniref:biofilm development regulator YmgB/AriR family protein n=1 Tax=Pantoea ananas TaxID=553 RepID=UPI00386419CC|nr:hypothetical protein [Pantoea ananatis]
MQQAPIRSGQELSAFLLPIGDQYEDEKKILCETVTSLLVRSRSVSRRTIIFYLIAQIESTNDIVRLDILRNCLELVTGPDAFQGN